MRFIWFKIVCQKKIIPIRIRTKRVKNYSTKKLDDAEEQKELLKKHEEKQKKKPKKESKLDSFKNKFKGKGEWKKWMNKK